MSGKAAITAAAAVALSAVACWFVVGAIGAVPGYDASWHLVWGDQLIHGHKPSVDAWAAPTEHPLLLALTSICALAGSNSPQLLLALTLLALLITAPVLAALARAAFASATSGIVGWVALAGGYGLLLMALRGYLDVWFILLVSIAALAGATRNPRSAALPLALAGLLRPEAWLLAGLALVLSWRESNRADRIALLAAATLPAVIWFAIDALLSGDPLLSLSTARTLALEDGGGAMSVFATSLFGGIRGPLTLLGMIGAIAAVRLRGVRPIAVVLMIGASGIGIALLIALAGLSLLPRYLLLADLALSLFCGFAVAGWATGASTYRHNYIWRLAGITATALALVGAIALGAPSKLAGEVHLDAKVHGALEDLLADAKVHKALECGPLTFPSFRLIPDARLILANDQQIRGRGEAPAPEQGVAITVTTTDRRIAERYSHPGIKLPVDEAVPPGFSEVSTSGPLTAWARCASPSAGKG